MLTIFFFTKLFINENSAYIIKMDFRFLIYWILKMKKEANNIKIDAFMIEL